MEKGTTTQPSLGTWAKLPTEEVERKPKVIFDVNIPVDCVFIQDEPMEFQGDNGAYYIFPVRVGTEEKVIMTSAWTLLRALKINSPLKDKRLRIVKKLVKSKQEFQVIQY